MALDRIAGWTRPVSDFRLRGDDRPADTQYGEENERSNFVAFMLGGVVVAGGLLAFLYYDDANFSGRDDLAAGSFGRIEAPAQLSAPNIRTEPAQPAR